MAWLVVWSEGVAPLLCLKKAFSIIIVTSRKYCLLFYDTKTVNLETTGPSNKTAEHHILIKKRKNSDSQCFPSFIDKDTWPANSPDLNPLYFLRLGQIRSGHQLE